MVQKVGGDVVVPLMAFVYLGSDWQATQREPDVFLKYLNGATI